MLCMLVILNATKKGCVTIQISGATPGSFINNPVSSETVDLEHIKHHYYGSHKMINPNGIIPRSFINFHDAHYRQPS